MEISTTYIKPSKKFYNTLNFLYAKHLRYYFTSFILFFQSMPPWRVFQVRPTRRNVNIRNQKVPSEEEIQPHREMFKKI